MKKIGQSPDEPGPQSQSEHARRLQEAAARIDVVLRFRASGLPAEEFAASILKDRRSLKPSPNMLRVWAHVYDRAPNVDAFLIDNLRWEEALLRKDVIAPITQGDDRVVAGLSAEERSQELAKGRHPLQVSANQLYAWRKAYLDGGRTVQALKDCPRGGKGGFRGWLANPENQALVNERERRLIVKSQEQYPQATLLRVNLQRCVGSKRRDEIPSAKTLDGFRRSPLGISPGDREHLAKGPRAYDVRFSPKMPTEFGSRHGEIITYDHTPADVFVLCGDRPIRPNITDCIDPYSGACRGIVVSPYTPGSAEIALVIRDAIREKPKAEDPYQVLCGLMKGAYSDRGKEMLSAHIRAALHEFGINDAHGQGYRPYSRGSIEGNLHKLIHTRFEPELPGYVGSEAKKRAPDVKAVLTLQQYAAALRVWIFTKFNTEKYTKRRLNGKRASRLEIAVDNHAPIEMPSQDSLMFGLMKRKPVTVEDTGVHFGGLFTYWPRQQQDMKLFLELIQERATCQLRYEPSDMSVSYLFRDNERLMDLYDAKADRSQGTERDTKWFEALRAKGRRESRDRNQPDREAARSGEEFLEYLEEQRAEAEEMPVAAVAGGGKSVRRILPIDHGLRRPPAKTSGPAALKPRRSSGNDWDAFRNR